MLRGRGTGVPAFQLRRAGRATGGGGEVLAGSGDAHRSSREVSGSALQVSDLGLRFAPRVYGSRSRGDGASANRKLDPQYLVHFFQRLRVKYVFLLQPCAPRHVYAVLI